MKRWYEVIDEHGHFLAAYEIEQEAVLYAAANATGRWAVVEVTDHALDCSGGRKVLHIFELREG